MNKRVFVLIISLLLFNPLWAQIDSKLIEFDNTSWDFGEVDEAKGAITHTFTFTNKSDQDFKLNSVQASCGCTTPEWSDKPVKPGGKGYIKAIFNPTGMLGEAFKTIILYGNFKDEVAKVLEIKGKIISYRFGDQLYVAGQLGYLRLSDNMFDFGQVFTNKKDTTYVVLVNDGTDTFSVLGFQDVPDYMKLWPQNLAIAPGYSGVIYAEIDGSKTNDWGELNQLVKIKTNDQFYFFKEAYVSANLVEDFSTLSKRQLKNAPHIAFSKNTLDFGTVKTGAIKNDIVTITNTGKSNLKIYKTYAICSCTVVGGLKNDLKPGESVDIKIEFDTVFKSGKQTKAITFYTNDPLNPVSQVVVVANVIDHH